MNVSEEFKDWWRKYDDVIKCQLIREKANQVHRSHQAMVKINKSIHSYGNNRTGIRGGKFTTFQARAENAAKRWLSLVDELKYMVATL